MARERTRSDSVPHEAGEHALREIGRQLREARVARDEDLRAIAAYLRIKPDYLAALENGDLAATPGLVYASGFLRSYAGHLELDGAALAARLKQGQRSAAAPPPLRSQRQTQRGAGMMTVAALLLAGAVWVGYDTLAPRLAGSAGLLAQTPVVATPPLAWPTVQSPPPLAVDADGADRPPLARLVSADGDGAPMRAAGADRPVPPVAPSRDP